MSAPSRFREKDPDSFDPTLRALLEQSLREEIVIPCENQIKARRIRSQIYSLRRAWRERDMVEHVTYKWHRSRVLDSHSVMQSRTTLFIPEDMPYCLILDSRNDNAYNLQRAIAYNGPTRHVPAGPRGIRILHPSESESDVLLPYDDAPTVEERVNALSDLLSSLDAEEDQDV